ncbi:MULTISPECIES: RNA methyltransferase [unclassified Clostridium]|uniref:TrmH family RNA methyltransferase n=1 Tax=unclassified Clostridium TaxID=2614128 RepID=UPI000297DC01|nr:MULTISPECIES: RNA methyltransferase [unclassified Clostridium]EKQ56908.1 MAG: rRNA methylase [Clostridium sp. Maddingley MBC34-26]
MIFIESKENNLFKNTKKLKERKNRNKSNKYIIEGFRLVQEAFKAKVHIDYLIITEDAKEKIEQYLLDYIVNDDIKIYRMSDNLFKELISTENPQGILAVINMNNMKLKAYGDFYLLCDKLQDPGNLGTIIRTAHAAGVQGIILTKGTVDIYNEKTIRSTMGSIFYVPIHYDDENLSLVNELKGKGFNLVVTSLDTNKNFFQADLRGKVLLTVGNEGNGVSGEVLAMADTKVKIPMPGNAESLNVAIAASVIMYEKVRQNEI